MVFGLGKPRHKEITAEQLDSMLRADEALVVDVREPDEFAAGHIPGAMNMPLSSFQASKLPHPAGKKLILNCQGGKRSGMALDKCGLATAEVDTHLAGGFGAWQAARLPVER
ncbi:rhodanese-like domain-containing protein [Novosphingobium malaysiense]|uniref:Sulfurtransferase n=1 Tax=Novosphingobium malaysiense TaxID=1348853 RepID=A0A0B1ZJ76_9SPHN|nr:rhodanese-like domain-containing protein [Novosphingobium malaysiense]KHK91125.1 sulfurtransferase [Novosphingobium malaysiense]